jgi:hypothetical protein
VYANDGAFYAKGNQLIPINETSISVKKEILTLKKIRNEYIEVSVYYEFYNPEETKNITVGFEAFSPQGDVYGVPKNGLHPYMNNFTVELNGNILTYQVAYVDDTLYAKNGIIKSKKLKEILDSTGDFNAPDFFYVYYFNTAFKKGLNIIKHTYSYKLSNSVLDNYYFEYVLTAAKRWSNKQIDDFTLIIDNGDFEEFNIDKTFFTNASEWIIDGIGKTKDIKASYNQDIENNAVQFIIQKGTIIFQKKNFKPNGDLVLYSPNYAMNPHKGYLPFSCYQQGYIDSPKTEFEKKILKNLPFARRGYIFTNPELKKYFEGIDWYIPNPNYVPDVEMLTEEEKLWIKKWQ